MTGHIFIEGEIGTDVTTKTVRDSIALYPEAEDFIVHINSVGGDVYEGYNIGQIIRGIGKKTTAQIGALCASIASFDAVCCDEVIMAPQGDFMIHLPTGTLSGNAEDLRRGAAQLDRIKSELIDRYMTKVAKKGLTREQLSTMIDKETSMSPAEAHDFGFVDAVQERMKAVAKFDFKKFNDMNITEEQKGIFANFGKKLDEIIAKISKASFHNVALTLADGSIINSDAETPDAVVGSMLSDEQGQPLADGTYETADGIALVVAGGKCASADPIVADKAGELEKLKQENASLKEQLAKSTGQVDEVKKEVAAIAKQATEFKNLTVTMREEFEKLKNQTFGDPNPPAKTEVFKKKEIQEDPMLEAMGIELGNAWLTSRNFGN